MFSPYLSVSIYSTINSIDVDTMEPMIDDPMIDTDDEFEESCVKFADTVFEFNDYPYPKPRPLSYQKKVHLNRFNKIRISS